MWGATRQQIGKCTRRSASLSALEKNESDSRTNYNCFTMTVHLLTMPKASVSSQPKEIHPNRNNLFLHLVLSVWLVYFPNLKEIINRTRLKGQFLKWGTIGLNSPFLFFYIDYLIKVKESCLHYYLFLAGGRKDGFVSFFCELVQNKTTFVLLSTSI